MSLADMQSLVLNLVIDQKFAERFFDDSASVQANFSLTTKELAVISGFSEYSIVEFQNIVYAKRARRVRNSMKLTKACMPLGRQEEFLRSFAASHVMRKNEWVDRLPDFFDLVKNSLGNTDEEGVLGEAVEFERWMYEMEKRTVQPVSGKGWVRSHLAQVRSFRVPVEALISETINDEQRQTLLLNYGQSTEYLLAFRNGTDVELFEIDRCYFEFLSQCGQPQSKGEVLECAARAASANGIDKQPEEMLDELLDLGVMVELEEEE